MSTGRASSGHPLRELPTVTSGAPALAHRPFPAPPHPSCSSPAPLRRAYLQRPAPGPVPPTDGRKRVCVCIVCALCVCIAGRTSLATPTSEPGVLAKRTLLFSPGVCFYHLRNRRATDTYKPGDPPSRTNFFFFFVREKILILKFKHFQF